MEGSTLLVGIDIGWSDKKRSCAFAASDPNLKIDWPVRADEYGSDALKCCRFKLTELVEFLRANRDAMKTYKRTIVVVDGPLGPLKKPSSNRDVDSFFRKEEFNNRMQPADINNGMGRTYVNATYQVAETLGDHVIPWVKGAFDTAMVVAETNPTVGLALLNHKYDVNKLPSRKRPLLPPSNLKAARAIRAKSDFYWQAGGNYQCATLLECATVAKEQNHENVAGLYCLAVASALCSNQAISCGDSKSGVYVFPNGVHPDWHSDLRPGLVYGEIQNACEPPSLFDFAPWIRANDASNEATTSSSDKQIDCDVTEELALKGNRETLLLCDNGGVWERHNDWLEGAAGPARVRCVENNIDVTLARANASTQWKSDPTTLSLARKHGAQIDHLSSDDCVSIEVEILELNF